MSNHMTKRGRLAFNELSSLGAPVSEATWPGVQFKIDLEQGVRERLQGISDQFWAISPVRRDRKSRRLRRNGWKYGINPKLAEVLKDCGLTASWQSDSILNIYVGKGGYTYE